MNMTIISWVVWTMAGAVFFVGLLYLGRWLGHKDRQWLGFYTVPLGTVVGIEVGQSDMSFRINYPGYWVATKDDCLRINARRSQSGSPYVDVEVGDVISYQNRRDTIGGLTVFLDKIRGAMPFGWALPPFYRVHWYNFSWIELEQAAGGSEYKDRARKESVYILKLAATSYFLRVPAVTQDNARVTIELIFNTETVNAHNSLVRQDSWYLVLVGYLTKYLLEYVQAQKVDELLVETDTKGRRTSQPQGTPSNPTPGKVFFEFAKILNHVLDPELDLALIPFDQIQPRNEGIIALIGQKLTGAQIIRVVNPEDKVWQALQSKQAKTLEAEGDAAGIRSKGKAANEVLETRVGLLNRLPANVAAASVLGEGFKDTKVTIIGGQPLVQVDPNQTP